MSRVPLSLTLVAAFSLSYTLTAQSKPPITRADYGQWETMSVAGGGGRGGGGGGGGFSPDGKWLAYNISRQNQTTELRLVKLADNTVKAVPFGAQFAFTSDSKFAAYSIGYSEAEQERMRTAQRPIQNKLAIVNLGSGETSTIDGIQSFTFSNDGAYIAMRPYPPTPAAGAGGGAAAGRGGGAPPAGGRGGGRGGAADSADEPVGGSLIIRQLAKGPASDTTFGNVGEFAWQDADKSHLLALAISAEGKTGNGIQLFDPDTTQLRVLESSPSAYTGLVWRKDAPDLALLKAKTDAKKDGPAETLLAWTGIGKNEKLHSYDQSADNSFPAAMRVVSFRRLSWSDDGNTIFAGIAKWDDLPPPARGRGAGNGRAGGAGASGDTTTATNALPPDEPASVDVWHWQDIIVSPRAKLNAAADRRRNLLSAWHIDSNKFVQLGKSFDESVTPMRKSNNAFVAEWSKYTMERTIGRPSADLYLQDMTTGVRTKIKDNTYERDAQMGPAGKYLVYLQDDNFFTVKLATKAVTNISKAVPTSFIDKESDETIKQKPDFGIAGWTKDDAAVLLYDKFDIWMLPTDGSKATKLTSGAAEQVRHRITRIGQDEDWLDLAKPVYVSLFGTLSKKSGYGVLKAGAVDRLVWLDKSVGALARAKESDVYSYTIQDYDDSPDLFIGSADLKSAKQVTHTNEFQSKYAWGKSETVDFTTDKGMKLQGTLYYPAGYEAGKKYPMITYIYEKLSDGVHSYVVPSDKSYYNITVFMSQGYFVFEPDIVFRPRQPGLSVVECVTAGIKKVTSMGAVDPKRVGVIGHSWGGFDTAFLATHTQGVFAAAIAGAPITDLVSNYGNHHWSSGIAETDHIETGQQRMEVPLYEDLPDYIANSAVFNVQNMTVPLLIEVGDADGTVFWHQGIELYNIARRAKKNVVLIQYEGEDHGLRQAKNQIDYQRRILEWFGYYLKGDEALDWITKGTEKR